MAYYDPCGTGWDYCSFKMSSDVISAVGSSAAETFAPRNASNAAGGLATVAGGRSLTPVYFEDIEFIYASRCI